MSTQARKTLIELQQRFNIFSVVYNSAAFILTVACLPFFGLLYIGEFADTGLHSAEGEVSRRLLYGYACALVHTFIMSLFVGKGG